MAPDDRASCATSETSTHDFRVPVPPKREERSGEAFREKADPHDRRCSGSDSGISGGMSPGRERVGTGVHPDECVEAPDPAGRGADGRRRRCAGDRDRPERLPDGTQAGLALGSDRGPIPAASGPACRRDRGGRGRRGGGGAVDRDAAHPPDLRGTVADLGHPGRHDRKWIQCSGLAPGPGGEEVHPAIPGNGGSDCPACAHRHAAARGAVQHSEGHAAARPGGAGGGAQRTHGRA